MIASFETRSPGFSIRTPNTASARDPIGTAAPLSRSKSMPWRRSSKNLSQRMTSAESTNAMSELPRGGSPTG